MNLNVSLTDELVKFVQTKVDAGHYTSLSEVVREALRLMEESDKEETDKLGWLQEAWKNGLESGDFAPLSAIEVKAEGRKSLKSKS